MTYDQYSQLGREGFSGRPRDETITTNEIHRKTQQKFNETREKAAGGLDSIVDAAAAAADDLREHHQEGLSQYVSEIADSVSSIAGSLRHKSVDELIHEVGAVARRNPTLFLAGSLAVGLGIGRFARASAKHSDHSRNRELDRLDVDEDYPRNLAGDAYPERVNDDIQHVTEEDYLADDFAFAGGEDIDLENTDFRDRGQLDERADPNSEVPSKRRVQEFNQSNQPIGGDFYE